MTRVANASRKTSETDIEIELNIDGTGKYEIDTGVNFFNHMLESFSRHSFIDLKIKAIGDIEIDDHHTVEDVGILLGEVFAEAIGDKKVSCNCCHRHKRKKLLQYGLGFQA